MGFAAPVIAGIGAGMQVVGQISNMRQEMKQEAYNAEVAQRNAQLQELNAQRAEANAQEEMNANQQEGADWGEEARLQMGQIRAQVTAGGLLDIGSIANRAAAMRAQSARDQQRIRQEGMNNFQARRQEAYDFRFGASESRASAEVARGRGRSAFVRGGLNIGSSILGGVQAVQTARAV